MDICVAIGPMIIALDVRPDFLHLRRDETAARSPETRRRAARNHLEACLT